jgi:non-specific serine/threonine protein kinase/serine/threonine-protein kinase
VRRDVENGKEGDPEQISSVREGTPAKLQRRLGGDLDDITMMALRKEPVRRYSSVEQFAEDIRRHLDGLAVAANKGSWSYRAEKFVQRHKVGIAAGAVVLLAVAGGVGATIREARIARANAQRAEKRFNDVRKLANSFLFEFHDAIEHLQGATPARELVVKRALEYLDGLSQEAGTDASLQRELATAYERVGNVQGGAYRDSLGNYQGALESFRKARAIREQALKVSPEDEILRSQLAQEFGEIGGILEITGNLKGALENYKNGLDVLAASRHPNIKTRIRSEGLYDRYAMALAKSGDLPAAVLSNQKSIAIIDEVIKEDPSDRENVRDLAISCIHLGDSLKRMRKLPEALATYRRAHDAFQSIVEPANAQSKRDVNVADSRVADILRSAGSIRDSFAVHQSQLLDDMAAQKADPSNVLIREDVYIDYNQIAEDKLALGEIGEAMFNERKGIALDEAEVRANADNSRARDNLQSQYFTFGKILRRSKQTKEALAYFAKARSIAELQMRADPKDLDMHANFAESEMEMSEAQFALGNSDGALAGYLDANSVAEGIVAASPTNSEWRILLARTDQKLGEYYAVQAGKRTEAREKALSFYRKSLDLWKDLQGRNALGADYNSSPGEVSREIAACQTPLQH